ncbi:hypothetical protein CBR_g52628 [Chara braunii]|uniref:Tetratricopeptide repeat-containing protein n=1 Tax=Chara braunii TaxID=69332 RepID=A0A388MAV2_CHABU|nr:hypothetical protein CBR_g52628 [Chara braunii]|eukprot:GBG91592.1 hypothetical protein CBR_g52628 [Chara braunii]
MQLTWKISNQLARKRKLEELQKKKKKKNGPAFSLGAVAPFFANEDEGDDDGKGVETSGVGVAPASASGVPLSRSYLSPAHHARGGDASAVASQESNEGPSASTATPSPSPSPSPSSRHPPITDDDKDKDCDRDRDRDWDKRSSSDPHLSASRDGAVTVFFTAEEESGRSKPELDRVDEGEQLFLRKKEVEKREDVFKTTVVDGNYSPLAPRSLSSSPDDLSRLLQRQGCATELQPDWAEAHLTLARAQRNYGEPELALASFVRATKLGVQDVGARTELEETRKLVVRRRQLARENGGSERMCLEAAGIRPRGTPTPVLLNRATVCAPGEGLNGRQNVKSGGAVVQDALERRTPSRTVPAVGSPSIAAEESVGLCQRMASSERGVAAIACLSRLCGARSDSMEAPRGNHQCAESACEKVASGGEVAGRADSKGQTLQRLERSEPRTATPALDSTNADNAVTRGGHDKQQRREEEGYSKELKDFEMPAVAIQRSVERTDDAEAGEVLEAQDASEIRRYESRDPRRPVELQGMDINSAGCGNDRQQQTENV